MGSPIGATGGTDTSAMDAVSSELKQLALEVARQNLKKKKTVDPANAAKQASSQ